MTIFFFGLFYFKLLLKFPGIITSTKNLFFKEFLSYLYKMKDITKYVEKKKNLFVQITGLLTSYIIKEKTKTKILEANYEQTNFQIANKIFIILLQNIREKDQETNDLFKKILYYFREICNSPINFITDVKIGDISKINSIHAYVLFLRICFCFLGYDSLLKQQYNLEFYFALNKCFCDIKLNHRIFNDYMFVFRLLSEIETFF